MRFHVFHTNYHTHFCSRLSDVKPMKVWFSAPRSIWWTLHQETEDGKAATRTPPSRSLTFNHPLKLSVVMIRGPRPLISDSVYAKEAEMNGTFVSEDRAGEKPSNNPPSPSERPCCCRDVAVTALLLFAATKEEVSIFRLQQGFQPLLGANAP